MDDRDYELFFDITQSLTRIAETLDRIADVLEQVTNDDERSN